MGTHGPRGVPGLACSSLAKGQLERTLHTYIDHYNRQRPHRALGLAAPDPPRELIAFPHAAGAREQSELPVLVDIGRSGRLKYPSCPGILGKRWRRRLLATARNRRSDGIPMIACATQSVTSSASVTLLLASHGRPPFARRSNHPGPR